MNSVTTEYKGKRRVKDLDSGEIFEIDYIKKTTDRHLKGGWKRVYLGDFLEVLLEIGNTKIRVFEFILNNVDTNNKLTMSILQVSEKVGISYKTTHETFKKLAEKGLIRKYGTAWVVMPSFVSTFGSDAKNARLLTEYSEAEETSLFDELETEETSA
ncbi:replication/maintenance protein RepL [Campylobacter concisus]|jgi:replication initiation protein|uniref:replication/maintenance protein RepL n=3 Tax=Campylobacter concisus TaxID=199 RepID=UPI000CD974D5|nr:replication/maintenance protein RepL [Campylobacter concisus]